MAKKGFEFPEENHPMNIKAFGRLLVIFGMGFFALTGQTLLFRQFLTVFEGSELAIGCFFGSWLLWVAVGALVCLATRRYVTPATRHFALLPLLLIPAFVLQRFLLLHARGFAGVEAYELFPLAKMIILLVLLNSPVAFLTGLLFTLGCHWRGEEDAAPVPAVYMLEAFGSFAGGVLVTLLLAAHVPEESIFLLTALLPAAAAMLAAGRRLPVAISTAATGAIGLLLLFGADREWRRRSDVWAWTRLLPQESYSGTFTTSQGRYLYGQRDSQFVVMAWGSITETLPATEAASELVAVHLAQHPHAVRIAVIGAGKLAVCNRFLNVPGVGSVTWFHPDPEYPKRLLEIMPETAGTVRQRLEVMDVDARQVLAKRQNFYDLIIIDAGDAATLAANRYRTREFLQTAAAALATGGVLSLSVPGAETFLDQELAMVGASSFLTLTSIFPKLAIQPGDTTWFYATSTGDVLENGRRLRNRFAEIAGSDYIFPAEAISSLYPANRIRYQRAVYERYTAEFGAKMLTNTDQEPKALLHSLLLLSRRLGTGNVTPFLHAFGSAGTKIMILVMIVFWLLRVLYRRSNAGYGGDNPAGCMDAWVLVFVASLVNMSICILLMFRLQSGHGSIFLYAGLVSSLFMFGLYLGSSLASSILSRRFRFPGLVIAGAATAHVILLFTLGYHSSGLAVWQYAMLFLAGGVMGGTYIPPAVELGSRHGPTHCEAGASLEICDHLGGAAGALAVGILLLPVIGIQPIATLLAGLLVLSTALLLLPVRTGASTGENRRQRWAHPLAYGLAGLAFFTVTAANLIRTEIVRLPETGGGAVDLSADPELDEESTALVAAAEQLLGVGGDYEARRHTTEFGAFHHLIVHRSSAGPGFFFTTREAAGNISGFNGPIIMAVFIDDEHVIRQIKVLSSRETPTYFRRVHAWLLQLSGRNVFTTNPRTVDAVSGATRSSRAILLSIERCALALRQALDDEYPPSPAAGRSKQQPAAVTAKSPAKRPAAATADPLLLLLPVLLGLALAAKFRPLRSLRMLVLLAVLLVCGVWRNIQFSTDQIWSLLSGTFLRGGWSVSLVLVVAVPLMVMWFGNIYCGYLCPFGAIQELIGDLRPRRIESDIDKQIWRYSRAVKYWLLLLLALIFAATHENSLTHADPLVSVWIWGSDGLMLTLILSVLVLAFFFRRFWCRNLCPAGAFLSLLNRFSLLGRWMPATVPGRCDLGVISRRDLDCISCDRCRQQNFRTQPRSGWGPGAVLLIAAQFFCLLLFLLLLTAAFRQQPAAAALAPADAGRKSPAAARVANPAQPEQHTNVELHEPPVYGRVRTVDLTRIREMIRRGELSDKEALHYHRAEAAPATR